MAFIIFTPAPALTAVSIAINSTPITGGVAGRVLFESATNKVGESANLFFDTANSRAGIGTSLPLANLHSEKTTEQLRLSYNTFNYISFLTASDGYTEINITGTTKQVRYNNLLLSSFKASNSAASPSFSAGGPRTSGNWLNIYGGNTAGAAVYISNEFFSVNGSLILGNFTFPDTLILPATGRVGIANGNPTAKLDVVSITEQLRLGYNASNFINFTTESSGRTAINVVGTIPYLDITPITILGSTIQAKKGADIGSGTNLVLGADGNTYIITGNTTINAISTTNIQAGTEFNLIFSGTPTVKHNTAGGAGTAPFLLNLSLDLIAAPNTVLTVVYDGTSWQQKSLKIA